MHTGKKPMFKLKRKTAHGEITVKLFREPSLEEMQQLNDVVFKWTEPAKSDVVNLESAIRESLKGNSGDRSSKLGASPKETISMGEYKEPTTGLCLQMLDYPKVDGLRSAVQKLMAIAPITLSGWVSILRGNHCSIKFTPSDIGRILSVLKEHEIYATIVSDENNAEAGGQ